MNEKMEKFNIEAPLQKAEKEERFFIGDIINKIKAFFPEDIKTTIREKRALFGEGWKKKGFDLKKKLNNVKGPLIEIGGPTEDGYSLIDTEKLEKKLYVSNIFPGCPVWRRNDNQQRTYYGKVDFMADGRNLPLKNETIGALFASCIGDMGKSEDYDGKYNDDQLREKILEEAMRILEPKGILVIQGARKDDYQYAEKLGFELVQQTAKDEKIERYYPYRNCVFEKSKLEDE